MPSIFLDMIEVKGVAGERVAMTSGIDTPSSEFECIVYGEIPMISLVEDAIGESGAGADGEDVSLEPSPVRVDVI
jgi:hypothetical protein